MSCRVPNKYLTGWHYLGIVREDSILIQKFLWSSYHQAWEGRHLDGRYDRYHSDSMERIGWEYVESSDLDKPEQF